MSGHKINFRLLVFCLTALFCLAPASQDDRPLVAVIEPIGNANVTTINKMSARGKLEEYITSTKKYRVLDRARTDQLLKEHGFGRSEFVDASKAKEVGKILQADILCISELHKEKGEFIAICSLVDVVTGEVFESATELIEADSSVEIQKSIERAAAKLLKATPPQQQAQETYAKITTQDMYVVGYDTISGTEHATLWKFGDSQRLSNVSSSQAWSFSVSGSDIYVAGHETVSGTEYAMLWKNGVPQRLSNAGRSHAYSVFVSGKDIYVAGYEINAEKSYATLWKNGVAQRLGEGRARQVFIKK